MNLKSALLAFLLCAGTMAIAQASTTGASTPGVNPDSQSSAASPTAPASQSTPSSQVPSTDINSGTGASPSGGDTGALQSRIESALRNEPSLGSSHIGVKVNEDSIDLTGTVGSSKDKLTAERIAQSFDGNRKLNDTLMVTGHGHSDLAPDHSAMNNAGTGNSKNPVTQGNTGNDNSSNPR